MKLKGIPIGRANIKKGKNRLKIDDDDEQTSLPDEMERERDTQRQLRGRAMSFEHVSRPRRRVIERITDAYCLRLLEVQRTHDFDARDLAEREERPLATIENCLQRAQEIELRKKQRGAL